jgi:hypothetical protein
VLRTHPFADRFRPKRSRFPDAVERIGKLYDAISTDQRVVFLDLLSRYEIHDDHARLIYYTFSHIEKIVSRGPIVICSPHDSQAGPPKSGIAVVYEFRSMAKSARFDDQRIAINAHLNHELRKFNSRQLVIVDDFSGTGETFIDAIDRATKFGFNKENISCVALYSMVDAMFAVESHGVNYYSGVLARRAISDFDIVGFSNREDAMAAYIGIERLVGIGAGDSRGYGQSESIVSMVRTPDNTLPIFWQGDSRPGATLEAPFPR